MPLEAYSSERNRMPLCSIKLLNLKSILIGKPATVVWFGSPLQSMMVLNVQNSYFKTHLKTTTASKNIYFGEQLDASEYNTHCDISDIEVWMNKTMQYREYCVNSEAFYHLFTWCYAEKLLIINRKVEANGKKKY